MDDATRHGYVSEKEYEFHETEINGIIRVATTASTHHEDMISFHPETHGIIRRSISTDFERASDFELGPLDEIPIELSHEIMSLLDMKSIFNFRQVSRSSRRLVDSFYQYQRVASHGLDLFCALLRTDFATEVSLYGFHEMLCAKTCNSCGRFGAYVLIVPWKRYCYECIRSAESPVTRFLPVQWVQTRFMMTEPELARLKTFKTLPGIYTLADIQYERRIEITTLDEVAVACGREVSTQKMPCEEYLCYTYPFMSSCRLPYYNDQTGQAEGTLMCMGCYEDWNSLMFFAYPWNYLSGKRGLEYGRDEFLEHFKLCKAAQSLWEDTVKKVNC
ncbi:hypothetical protein N7466_001020 [Penicillium verhagenii]|uniref:uncharacterized protein n=1 Tax=Penicillium verhagenii TaxID=1562060 RepID=UPI002544E618|nr:uncharacterized protein N7466_001020 [Penicillium verhagenii]KAJ5948005.1 hypothetical protein N7466_001020 [Penicillium verhagenii]